ncbi:MAG: aminotransferase class IV, partial [Deltaproteobacteria bacterium]|nr:aminotransferase class IV [Deltaproteobacteria bacterium]
PYIHRLAGKKFGGLRLTTYPEPRQTPLARYKTTNYLYYLLAGNWARDRGYDEALITNSEGTVSETNTANLLLVKDGAIIRPNSPHALPGVMEQAVCRWFRKNGYTVKRQAVSLESLRAADQVLATNSLMGTVPVSQLDDWVLKTDPQWIRSVNPEKSIFYGGVAGSGDILK